MVMERLEAAKRMPENQGQTQQFAIDSAQMLLAKANIADPGPLKVGEEPAVKTPKEKVLTDELAIKLRNVLAKLDPQTQIGSLMPWNENRRAVEYSEQKSHLDYLNRHAYNEETIGVVNLNMAAIIQLADAPQEWQQFLEELPKSQKTTMISAIRTALLKSWPRDEKKNYNLTLREAYDAIPEKHKGNNMRSRFLQVAFKDIAQPRLISE